MKAHGVPALIRHLQGEITRDEAAEIGRADTRHYAKRQFTWFRHQLPEFEWVKPEAARGWVEAFRSPDGANGSAPRMAGTAKFALAEPPGTPLSCQKSRLMTPSLDFRGLVGYNRATFGKSEPQNA